MEQTRTNPHKTEGVGFCPIRAIGVLYQILRIVFGRNSPPPIDPKISIISMSHNYATFEPHTPPHLRTLSICLDEGLEIEFRVVVRLVRVFSRRRRVQVEVIRHGCGVSFRAWGRSVPRRTMGIGKFLAGPTRYGIRHPPANMKSGHHTLHCLFRFASPARTRGSRGSRGANYQPTIFSSKWGCRVRCGDLNDLSHR
jgi:hypothetical protein